MVSCSSPFFPKIVIFTSSSKLASLPLKSVAFDASTVKIFWVPSPLENVSPLDSLVTSCGAGGGAFCCSRCAAHFRSRYTPTVRLASSIAAAADQRAYFPASLLFMPSVTQNFAAVYRTCNVPSEEGEDYPAPSAFAATFGKIPIFAAATLSRFVFFTKYMASSARCSNPSLVRESTGEDATPTLGVSRMFNPCGTSQMVSRPNLCNRRPPFNALPFQVCGGRIPKSPPP